MKLEKCPMCSQQLKLPEVPELRRLRNIMTITNISCPCGTTCTIRADGEYQGGIVNFNPKKPVRARVVR
ncbi:hypothetical protein LCGC14_0478590 [marine sediment metagenome]|uniref:Uncharacterized protein n=1 Tax=marine sediment metagenome TaxID=412755 RepID=A0A0F9S9Y8_9ZZZZ